MALKPWVVLLAVAALSSACSKKKAQETERTEPWRVDGVEAGPDLVARYVIEPRCEASLELKAKEATPRGAFRVCRGELDVDLSDLAKSHGSLAVDLGSIEMQGEGDAGRSDEYTSEAEDWLDIGASRPEAERERLRWATFTLASVDELGADSAHGGKLVRGGSSDDVPAAESDAGDAKRERRLVALRAKGTLLVHGVRVDVTVPMHVVFEYAGRAAADQRPERLSLETRRPVTVSLQAHDVKPRNSAGVFLAEGVKLLGTKVGREARVSLSAEAKRAP